MRTTTVGKNEKPRVNRQHEAPNLTELHMRLRYARKRAGYRSQDLAAPLLKVSKNTLNRYESGDSVPDAEVISMMVDVYNCGAEWLLLGRGNYPGVVSKDKSICPTCGRKVST